MSYYEKGPVSIIDFSLWLLPSPKSQKKTQFHQNMCGCKMSIQAETYQGSLNIWRKQGLFFFNCETHLWVYPMNNWIQRTLHIYTVKLYYLMENIFTHVLNMCDYPDKDIKFTKWSCVFNCCSECPGFFVTDAEMNSEKDMGLTFILFCQYLKKSRYLYE